MRDLIRNYRETIRPRDPVDGDPESRPLLSSCSSCGSLDPTSDSRRYTGTFRDDEDTTDCEKSCRRQARPLLALPTAPMEKDLLLGRQAKTTARFFDAAPGSSAPFLSKANLENNNPKEVSGTHSSLVTIFVIWNTIIGSSLLAMPWGLEKAGLIPGTCLTIAVAAICLYTCNAFLKAHESLENVCDSHEISDLCRILLGAWAEVLAKFFSLVVQLGSCIVYWVLMCNFLYNSVQLLYEYGQSKSEPSPAESVVCPSNATALPIGDRWSDAPRTTFERVWNLYTTVPIILAIPVLPILNMRSVTFFTKFNSLGTLSVFYMLFFVGFKGLSWGPHLDVAVELDLRIKPTFCALGGMLSLSYFIHNMIVKVMKNNRNRRNNTRDLSVAFGLVAFTYTFVGVVFYVTFPLPKLCLQDNFLNNFDKRDPAVIVARLVFLFQLFTVFPLMSYVLRLDLFANVQMIYASFDRNFSYPKVIVVNVLVVTCCILFSCFLPKIGTLIRYTGAISGLVYMFLLPSLIRIALLKKRGALTIPKFLLDVLIMMFGVINLISQFFIKD